MCAVQYRFALQLSHPCFGACCAIMGVVYLASRDVACAHEVGPAASITGRPLTLLFNMSSAASAIGNSGRAVTTRAVIKSPTLICTFRDIDFDSDDEIAISHEAR